VVALEVQGSQEAVVKEHHGLVYGLKGEWVPIRIRFLAAEETERARLSLRLVVKEANKRGQSWFDGAYLVPVEAIQGAEAKPKETDDDTALLATWQVRVTST
jgi:sirohydrochlorin ferrochelatase